MCSIALIFAIHINVTLSITSIYLIFDHSFFFYLSFNRDMEEIGSADECFDINDRASETSYGSGNSAQDPDRVEK